uniref:Uncharacterized protein n=1 Tax=Pseudomonas phage RVTF4 TaxID=3236931 RepID=A0AB39CCI8_9VIRU
MKSLRSTMQECRVALEDDGKPIEFMPLTTYAVCSADNSYTGLYHLMPSSKRLVDQLIGQSTYVRYDALHYWFSEPERDSEELVYDQPDQVAAMHLASITYKPSFAHLTYDQVPDWKQVRDNTSFLVGPALGDLKQFQKVFLENLGDGYVHIDVDDMHSRTDRSSYSVLYKLMEMDTLHKNIVEQQLINTTDVRKALAFVSAEPDEEISIDMSQPGDGAQVMTTHRKWFWESKWAYDYLLEHFPQFHKNFHTIVITNAYRRFHSDDFNINKLYRVLARLGRVNTRVVFIG